MRSLTTPDRCATVVFEDAAAFTNANTAHELQQLQTPAATGLA